MKDFLSERINDSNEVLEPGLEFAYNVSANTRRKNTIG